MTNSVAQFRFVDIRYALVVLVLWQALGGTAAAEPTKFNHRKLAEAARSQFIVPSYQKFGRALSDLRTGIAELCRVPAKTQLDVVRSAYRDVIATWGRAEIIAFGPIAAENRFERIFYWPDRKGIGARQVRRILATSDPGAIDVAKLTRKSVAVQGLSALELLLFGSTASTLADGTANAFSCRYALAIADNLANINATILRGWRDGGEFARIWQTPGRDNPAYLADKENTMELVKAFDHGLTRVRDARLAPALGIGSKRKARPVLWRSRLSVVLIHANIIGLRDLFFKGGLAEAYLESSQSQIVGAEARLASIKRVFEQTLRMTDRLAREGDPFGLPDIQSRLVRLGFPLKNVRLNAVSALKAAAGLSLGFNASDGD
ncbi:MAG: imelysin family protein [Hyphomicrobiaceae bacterium]